MAINIDEENLKHGLLGLVIAIVEIIKDTLRHQAMERIESGRLAEEEIERLGSAFEELDKAIEDMKREQGISEAVHSVRKGLDDVASDIVNKLVDFEKWKGVKR